MASVLFFIDICNINTLVQFDHTEIKYKELKNHSIFFNYQFATSFDKFVLLPSMD